jgi:hypothetical protein
MKTIQVIYILIRTALALVGVYFVQQEAGVVTSIVVALVFVMSELQCIFNNQVIKTQRALMAFNDSQLKFNGYARESIQGLARTTKNGD